MTNEHRVPAVDRAIQVLESLERRTSGTLRDLAQDLGIPRSTVYRILNSLEAGGFVARDASGAYTLGSRLIRLAQAVPQGYDLVAIARPHLDRLARELSSSVKLSVLDGSEALVVAMAVNPGAYSLLTQVGRRFPLHAGGASKVLAAYLLDGELDRLLPDRLERFTDRTIANRAELRRVLEEVRRRGWGEDTGEHTAGIRSIAAPIFGPERTCVAAVSVPYFADEGEERVARFRDVIVQAAGKLTVEIGGAQPRAA